MRDLGQNWSAATHYAKAARAYKAAEMDAQHELYLKLSIEIWTEEGKFSQAAKSVKDLAEEMETDEQFEDAAKMFLQAAEYYENCDSTRYRISFYLIGYYSLNVSTASGCKLRAAECLAFSGKFAEAATYFTELTVSCMKKDLGKYKHDEYAIKAALCHLANGDLVAGKKVARKMTNQTSQSGRFGRILLVRPLRTLTSIDF